MTKHMFLALAMALLAPGAGVLAQGYPARPVQLVIPFPPGGATDIAARLVGKKLEERLGQPIVMDNRPGAGTIIGATYAARAQPDGYTLLISSGSTFTVNPAITPRLPYDPVRNFEPIGLVARVPLLVLAHRDVPVNDMKQLVAAAQRATSKYMYGSFGNGTTAHFTGESLWHTAGIKLEHVAYKGSAPAMADLLAGQIPFTIDTVAAALPHLKAGKIKAIAATGASRAAQLPQVPTVAESGVAGFSSESWLAIFAPRGLPAEVQAKLQKALADTMKDPEVRDKLLASGLEPAYESAATVAARIEGELPRMRSVAARSGIRAD